MLNLLKADFYKLFKSKSTYILFIICVVLSLFSVVLYKIIASLPEDIAGGFIIDGRSLMFGSFSLTQNTGLIIPIFAGIFTLTDIRHGTIRNKILFGNDRVKVYLSHFIVSTVFCILASLISFLVLTFGSLIFFKYGREFNSDEVLNFIKCFIIGILAFVYIASLTTFFSLVTKSTPLTCVLTLVITIGLGLIASLKVMLNTDKLDYLFYLMPTFSSTMVSAYGEISNEMFWCGLISFIVFITINTIGGILLFKKLDLK